MGSAAFMSAAPGFLFPVFPAYYAEVLVGVLSRFGVRGDGPRPLKWSFEARTVDGRDRV